MNPSELKQTMFQRVYQHGRRFNLFYDANDVICINIINPWTKNLVEIANLLKVIPELRIKKVIRNPTHFCLVGTTDVGTTYEVRLWTTLIAQYVRWLYKNNISLEAHVPELLKLIEKQKLLDSDDVVR